MKPILEELYDGRIFPAELILPKDPQYRPLSQKISDAMKIWREKLSETDYQQLEALLNLHSHFDDMEATAAFAHGFKLGALIMMEVLAGREEVVR